MDTDKRRFEILQSTFIHTTGEMYSIHLFKNTERPLCFGIKRSNGGLYCVYTLIQKGVPFATKKERGEAQYIVGSVCFGPPESGSESVSQRYRSGSGYGRIRILLSSSKNSKKNLDLNFTVL